MKNNYQAFLLIGALSLMSLSVNAGNFVSQTANNDLMRKRMGSGEPNASGGGFPVIDAKFVAEIMKSSQAQDGNEQALKQIQEFKKAGHEITKTIKNQNSASNHEEKARALKQIEKFKQSGYEVTNTIKNQSSPSQEDKLKALKTIEGFKKSGYQMTKDIKNNHTPNEDLKALQNIEGFQKSGNEIIRTIKNKKSP